MSMPASPRPWRVIDPHSEDAGGEIFDAEGSRVCKNLIAANAALIVAAVNERAKFEAAHMEFPDLRPVIIAAAQRDVAVNERDRLRDVVRRFCDLFTPGTIHPNGTMERLIREARAAIGEN